MQYISLYISLSMYIYTHIYIHIYRERDRERERCVAPAGHYAPDVHWVQGAAGEQVQLPSNDRNATNNE